MPADSWLNRIWYSSAEPPAWLLPWAAVFGAVSRLRRWLYSKKLYSSVRLPRPVVVIGNLSVGGTGKTPLTGWLVERLRDLGHTPGVVMRGYGGSDRGPHLVHESDDAARVGDEALVLARRTLAEVAVGRNRPAAARMLIEAGCDVIVCDDGLQHYALARDCEIAVIDAERGFGNGRLLPAGPLRELASRLETVDAVVINGAGSARVPLAAAPPALRMTVRGTVAVSVGGSKERPLEDFATVGVHAVAGIGNPQRFFAMLRELGLSLLSSRELPDHADLKAEDIDFGDGLPVLMTEKDAVKCARFAQQNHWYVPVVVSFDADTGTRLLDIVTRSISSATQGFHG